MTRIRRPGFPILLAALALGGLMLALSPAGAPPVGAQQGAVPARPAGLTVSAVTHDSVSLGWHDPGDTSITHYQVLRRDRDHDALGAFTMIEENTGSPATSYTDTTVAPERRYAYRVQAVNRHGAGQRSSFAKADTPAAPAAPPAEQQVRATGDATGTISISGTVQVGERLTLSGSSTISDPDGVPSDVTQQLDYQWILNDGTTDADITGATEESYAPVLADLGKFIKLRVSFQDNASNAESLTSAATVAVIASTYGNVIYSAVMTVGTDEAIPFTDLYYRGYNENHIGSLEPLVFSFDGTDYTVTQISTNDLAQSLGVHFDRDPEPYPGLEGGPVGPGFKLYLDGTKFNLTPERINNFFSHSLSWSDGQTVQVRLVPNQAPVGAPTISGNPAVGQTLTADTSAISDPDGPASLTFSYQWVADAGGADESEIAGATGATYTATVADLGTTISVRVDYTDAEDFAESLTSAAVAVVPAGLWLYATLTAGQIMDAGNPNGEIGYVGAPTGTVSGGSLSPTMFTAAGTSHTVETLVFDPDLGSGGGLALQVTGEPPAGFSLGVGSERFAEADSTSLNLGIVSLYSWPPTPAVSGWSVGDEIAVWLAPPNTPATGLPTIGGTVQVGEPLTAGTSAIVDSNGLGGPFSYQWIRSDGTTDTEIEGATAATYTPVFAGEGQFLKVRVSFTDNGGNAEALTSAATVAVAASPYGAVIWAGTMTVELWQGGDSDILGWGRVPFSTPRGDLDQHTFVYDGVTHRWHLIYHKVAGANAGLRLIWEGSFAAVTTGRFNFWAHDDTAFTFDRATVTGSDILLPVMTGEIDWYNFVTRPLQLRLTVDRVGAGDVQVSGTVAVDATVAADVSGLTDPDGLPPASEMSYQWLYGTGADPTTYAVSTGETGSTYTVEAVHAQFSRRLAVRVSFTDGAGFEHTVYSARTGIVADAAVTNAAPTFTDGASTTRAMAENTGASMSVGAVVAATDTDNDTLSYSLAGTDAGSFGIVSGTGQIQTASGVTYDHEAKPSYVVTVSVSDGNGGTDTITVTISITDLNEPPSVPAAPAISDVSGFNDRLQVSWTAPSNTGKPAIDDYDVQYRTGTGSWSSWPHTGAATTATITGLEAGATYEVQVRAHNDEGMSAWSATGTKGTNTPPTFTDGASTTRTVAENTGASMSVGAVVAATDTDTLTYSLEGIDASSFAIVSTSGQIRTASGVTYDFEAKPSYSVTVKADDGNGGMDTIAVTINISDMDEPPSAPAAPTISGVSGFNDRLLVSWTAPSNTGKPSITDYDVQYRESGVGAWSDWSHTGTATTTTITGLDAGATYQVQVRAENDEGEGAWSASGTQATNAPPAFAGSTTTRAVEENTAAGMGVGAVVTATDADNDTLTYSLEGTDASSFVIVANSGGILTKSNVTYDHEAKSTYSVTVRAKDGQGGDATISVTITITDVDEPPSAPAAPGVAFTSGTTDGLDVSWDAPVDTGKPPLTSFEVQYRKTSASTWATWLFVGPGATAKIKGLDAGTEYEVQVRANNDEGMSAWSASGMAETDAAPAFASGDCQYNSCTVTFGESLDSTSGNTPPVGAFTLTAGGASLTIGGVSVSGTTVTLSSVSPFIRQGQAITLAYADPSTNNDTAALQDALGNDVASFSETLTNSSPYDFPSEPTQLSALQNGRNQIDVEWTAPTDNGGDANFSYRLEVSTDAGANWTTQVASQTATTYNHTGLMAGDTRHYRVFTVNIIGDSRASSTASATTNRPPTGALVIDGTAQVAEKLTANTSNISDADGLPADDQFNFQWLRVAGGNEFSIPGATQSSYRPVPADLGQTLRVRLDYDDNAEFVETLTSAATAAVQESPYGEIVWAATLTAGQAGTTLGFNSTGPVGSLEAKTFAPGAITVSQLTYDGGAGTFAVTGLGSGDYILYLGSGPQGAHALIVDPASDADDVFDFSSTGLSWSAGQAVEVRLTLNREPVGVPLISGAAVEGTTLTAGIENVTDADGLPASDQFRYQWIVTDGGTESEITGATGTTYTPELTDLGKTYTVRVDYTDNANFPESLTSAPTDPIEVRGQVIWSAELTVEGWGPTDSRSSGFDASSAPVRGALQPESITYNNVTYQVESLFYFGLRNPQTGNVLRKTMFFSTTAELPAGDYALWVVDDDGDDDLGDLPFIFPAADSDGFTQTPTELDWEHDDTVDVRLTVNRLPGGALTISGQAKVGTTATADVSGVTDADGLPASGEFQYQWFTVDSGSNTLIGGATDQNYTPVSADLGKSIRVRLRYTDDAFFTNTVFSAAAVVASGTGNHPPQFSTTSTSRPLTENTGAGVNVGAAVSASDADSGDSLTYTLEGTDAGSFDIVSTSGQIQTKTGVTYDFETQSSYSVTVKADDGNGGTDTVAVTINVVNVNEPPVISGVSSVSYAEGGTAEVASYSATDEEGATITWSLSGTDAGDFEIGANSGVLTFKTSPDHDNPADGNRDNDYVIRVQASDGANLVPFDVTVTVTGVDELPTIPSGPASVDYAENGTAAVATYSATDPEGDTISWALIGPDAGAFAIDAGGVLTFAATPDYENPSDQGGQSGDNEYSLLVVASDAGNNTATLAVTVTVTPVDETPVVGGQANVNYAENGTAAVATYSAADPEGDPITWSLAGADAGAFEIDATGVLTFAAPPDFENPSDQGGDNEYVVTVQAFDGTNMGTRDVTVTVTDANEDPVLSGPAGVGHDEHDMGDVAVYDASDPEGAIIIWTLAGTDSGFFSLSGGVLTFNTPPNFELPQDANFSNDYEITIGASDGANPVSRAVTVTVVDLEEPGTISLSSPQPQVGTGLTSTLDELDAIVGAPARTWHRSPDGSTAWSLITGATASSYTPVQGDLNYYLRVTVSYTDTHGPKTLEAVSANAVRPVPTGANSRPEFDEGFSTTRSVAENSAGDTLIGDPVEATDADPDDVDALTYSFSVSDLFTVDPATGQISVAEGAVLDHEAQPSHTVTLTVADPGLLEDTIAVTITITDVNEAPVAVRDVATTVEDTPVTIDVLTNDSDPEDDALTVTVSTPPSDGLAEVDAATNEITYRPNTDFEGTDSFGYQVTDGMFFSAEATVVVTVTAVNDAPAFPEGSGEREVYTGAAVDTKVGDPVEATDPDVGDTLTYALSGIDASSFEIDGDTGQITVGADTDIDPEVQDTYVVTVTASDGTLMTPIEVTITVTERPAITTGGGGGGGGGGPSPSELDFEWNVKRDLEALDGGHDTPTGSWSDGTTLWVLENGSGADDAIYAYDLKTGERLEEREFELDERNRAPRGVWSDGTVIWVSDSGQDRLFAYDLETGERLPERDLELDEDNGAARGIWSDGVTMWVLDSLFAYDLGSGELLAEYALDDANGDPYGIWSDGVTLWVSDHGAKRLFAYRLPEAPGGSVADDAEVTSLVRIREEEFTELSKASNNSPRGIWSDGEVIYVADESDDKVYSYNMPDAIDARLASLTLSGIEIGEFTGDRTEYEGVAAEGVTETTVEAEALQRRTTVLIEPADADGDDTNGHQLALEGVTEITVTVTSADGSRTRVYGVRLEGGAAQETPWTHCLRGDIAEGFSLVVYEGGSVEDLALCAESRDVAALYALHGGVYVSYILGAPEFVNQPFAELFADGVPPVMPLVAGSSGPPSADPNLGDGALLPWPECLRGEIAEGFSLVIYEGGSVDDLVACAESLDVTALYALHDDQWVSYILGAPEFVNRPFRELFTEGLPAIAALVARSEGAPAAN